MTVLALALACGLQLSAQTLWNTGRMAQAKAAYENGDEATVQTGKSIIKKADKAMKMPDCSVMDKKRPSASGDMHDYFSQARYRWPDPTKPDGRPYINRDGVSNPEINDLDRPLIGRMSETVQDCALAWYFTGNRGYAVKAASQVRTWFLDKATRMNPHFTYAQVSPGHNNDVGNGGGILDGYNMILMLEAVYMLEDNHFLGKKDMKRLRAWFRELDAWMMSSPQGEYEFAATNNHSIIMDEQLIAYRIFTGDLDGAKQLLSTLHERRIFPQVEPDGSQPRELKRTIAFHYSNYNLEHILDLAFYARSLGMDFFGRESEDGRSISKAIDFLLPYSFKTVEDWPWQQIHGWEGVIENFSQSLYRASLLDPSRSDWREAWLKLHDPKAQDRLYVLF